MSSQNAGSSCPGGSGTTCKPEKQTRRPWSPQEEAFLIVALKELAANSFRGDNGFKSGYQQRLEQMIKREFPGTNIRHLPHINSKLQIWKKQHGVLSMILARSGVGFNSNGKHMIECEDEQWQQIVKIEPAAKSMRYKSSPLLDDWDEIFGKDRATGDNAEDVEDAANDNYTAEQEEDKQQEQASNIHVDKSANEEGETSSFKIDSKDAKNKAGGKGKKRKQADPVAIVANVISELGRSTGAHLETIAQRMGYDFDMDESRTSAYRSLDCVTFLDQKQRFEVSTMFVEKYACFLLYKGLEDKDKTAYVRHLLNLRDGSALS